MGPKIVYFSAAKCINACDTRQANQNYVKMIHFPHKVP